MEEVVPSNALPTQQSDRNSTSQDANTIPMSASSNIQGTNDLTQCSMPTQSVMGEDSQANNDSEEINKKRKGSSICWEHFEKKKIKGEDKAICHYCNKTLSATSKNGTKHLLEHMNRCPLRKIKDIKQCLLAPNMKPDGKVELKNHTFDAQLARLHLAYMIIMHEYPLRMVEHQGFRTYSNTLQPLFKPISRNTLRSDILKIFGEEKSKIMNLLESIKSRIAITTDMWTASNQKRGYMAVTAHFIDNNWNLQSRIVRFLYVPCPHTAEAITDVLFECLLDWNIDSKLSTLTLDNCSTNDSMLSMLMNKFSPDSLLLGGEILHMRCAAHILNLIVKDGLDVIGDSIERIRDSVYYWTATSKRVEKFEETARHLQIRGNKKLVHDVKTRWNSTFFMLESAITYKSVFPRLKQRDSAYKTLPTDHDWFLATEICEKLRFFHVLTNMFSATRCPTTNKIFIYICELRLKMEGWLDSDYVEVNMMARKMIEKFKKYWEDIHKVFSIAIILDPRFKFRTIDYYFDKIYGEEAEIEKGKIQKIMYDFEKLYKSSSSKPNLDNVSSKSASSCTPRSGVNNIFVGIEDLGAYLSQSSTCMPEKSEFDSYLEEALLPSHEDFDILTWWKTQGIKYHILRSIAWDIYAIPVSTVASEAAFSTSGRFVSKHRSRLTPETLEALMCSQDWLWERLGVPSTKSGESGSTSSSKPPSRVANGMTSYSSDEDEEESVITTIF